MNWSQIEYFELAFEERSFAAAARSVPMSPQGFVKSLRSLEGELGCELFSTDRNGAQMPTEAGSAFHEFALSCIKAREGLSAQLERIGQRRNTIRLAAAIGSFGLLGMGFVNAYERSNPSCRIVVDDLPDLRVERSLRERTNDLGLTVLPVPQAEFTTVELFSCERYVWMRADDPLASKARVSIEDFDGCAVANVGNQFKGFGLFNRMLEEAGLRVESLTTSSEMGWLHQFAASGQGLAFTASSVLALYPDTKVVARPVEGMTYTIGISWLKDHALSPAERAFVDHCREERARRGACERF